MAPARWGDARLLHGRIGFARRGSSPSRRGRSRGRRLSGIACDVGPLIEPHRAYRPGRWLFQWAMGLLLAASFAALWPNRSFGDARALPDQGIVPPVVRPPGAPWLLGNTVPHPPHVTWGGPALVLVDAPEDLTAAVLDRASGGELAPHLLYTDRGAATQGVTWVLVYVENALPSQTLRVTLDVAPQGKVRGAMWVRWGANGRSGVAPASHPLPAGIASVADMFDPNQLAGMTRTRIAPGGEASRSWTVAPHQVLSVWQPVELVGVRNTPLPVAVSVWEGPVGTKTTSASGTVLSPEPSDVVRATVAHAIGTVHLPVPRATGEAVAWDLDNDSPTPEGVAGGNLCPAWVCLNGEIRTYDALAFVRGSDPLPGEYEPGRDPVDAPGRKPAFAVQVRGRLVRTGNYGDYGSLLRIALQAQRGRRVFAAVLPGFTHAIPWQGRTVTGGITSRWSLPAKALPPGEGYEVVRGSRSAVVESTVTPGAYAPWRIVVWSERAP